MHPDVFFGPGNEIRFAQLTTDTRLGERIAPFLELLAKNAPLIALPRQTADRRSWWYFMWRSEGITRFARDFVGAALGPSLSDFGRAANSLDGADTFDASVAAQWGANVLRVEVPAAQRDLVRERILALLRLVDEHPPRVGRRWRPIGRLLRDAELALEQGDAPSVQSLIQELRRGGHLEPINLTYLEVRARVAQGSWDEALRHDDLPSLLTIGMPRRVVEALVRAIYYRDVLPHVPTNDVATVRSKFDEVLLPAFRPLFASHRGLRGPECALAFLAAGTVSAEGRQDLLQSLPPELQAFGIGLRPESSPAPSPQTSDADVLQVADEALVEGDFDRAILHLERATPSARRARTFVRCALELDDVAFKARAIAAVDALPEEQRVDLMSTAGWARRVSALRAALGAVAVAPRSIAPPTVDGWLAWFRRLRSDTAWPGVNAAAESGCTSWDAEALARSPESLDEVVGTIGGNLPPWAAEALHSSIPSLLSSFLTTPADARLRPLLSTLLDLLATEERRSAPVAEAIVRLTASSFYFGVTLQEYREKVDVLCEIFGSRAVATFVPSALDALDMVLTNPSPDDEKRIGFAGVVSALAFRCWERIPEHEQVACRRLLREFDLETTLPAVVAERPADAPDEWTRLQQRYVALYSLQENALRRAAEIITNLCPTARVEVFSDHVGGRTALREAARTAELFVVVTGAAKHAATGFIQAERPSTHTTKYRRGTGFSALIEAVREWLSGLPRH